MLAWLSSAKCARGDAGQGLGLRTAAPLRGLPVAVTLLFVLLVITVAGPRPAYGYDGDAGAVAPTAFFGETSAPSVQRPPQGWLREAGTGDAYDVPLVSLVGPGVAVPADSPFSQVAEGGEWSASRRRGGSRGYDPRVDRLRAGEVPPPIKVDGTRIVDGNHRYVASRVVGVDIEVQPWRGSRRPVVNWDDLPIDPTDWGD